jgi:prepilin-type N-terminal cleavage/methylation domain-containing protein
MRTQRTPGRRMAGFTLVEALVALSLLSIITGMVYAFFLFAHKQVLVREKKAFEFDSALLLLESVEKNIRQSRATVLLEKTRWMFRTRNGDTASYAYTGETLYFNALPLTIGGRPLPGFSFTCYGGDSLLDVNGDHEVDFEEIDADGDGKIDGQETENIAWIKAAIETKAGADAALITIEAVKNNLQYDAGGDETYFK